MDVHIQIDVQKVVDDGKHNAFTDLAEFQGRYFLAHRSCPDGHMIYASSEIVVLQSDDTLNWHTVARFGVSGYDVRDPHFIVHRNRLFVYSSAWPAVPGDPRAKRYEGMRNFVIYSEDGTNWSEPHEIAGTEGLYFWRGASFGHVAYIGAKGPPVRTEPGRAPGPGDFPLVFLASEDGLHWTRHSVVRHEYGDEMAFLFEEDGTLVGVARDRRGLEAPASFVTSRPPYNEWRLRPLDMNVGGPFIGKICGQYFVAGRRMKKSEPFATVLCWLEESTLREFAVVPSGGDNGYPGFIQTGPRQGLLSYYSSHEGNTESPGKPPSAIYIARLTW